MEKKMSEETSIPEAQPAKPEVNLSLLASEHYGQNFHGEVRQDPVEIPKEESIQEEPQDIELSEPETAEIVEEDTPISSIRELIETNEYDPEWFDGLEVDVKVDGTPAKAKLSDLVKSYQIQEAAEKRLEEAKEKVKAQNQAFAQKQEQFDQSLQTAAKLITKVEQKLTSDFQKINWDDLEKNDPAEFAAQRMKMIERQQELANMKQEAVSEYQRNSQGRQAELEQSRQQTLMAEQAALLTKIPEWNDAEVAKTEKAQVGEYLLSQGLTQEEIANAYDHRIVVMARKAMQFDKAQGAEPAKKKLAKVPRTLKPGVPKTQAETNHIKTQDAISKLRESGSIDDALKVWNMRKGQS